MKIKPKKVYKDMFEAMKDCADRLINDEENLLQDGDTITIDGDDTIEFEVEVKDD